MIPYYATLVRGIETTCTAFFWRIGLDTINIMLEISVIFLNIVRNPFILYSQHSFFPDNAPIMDSLLLLYITAGS